MNYISVVRGRLKGSPEQAKAMHDGTVEQLSAMNFMNTQGDRSGRKK